MQREHIATLRDGAFAAAPQLVGIVPWGIVVGVAMVSAGLVAFALAAGTRSILPTIVGGCSC